jgi:hypothetical protein
VTIRMERRYSTPEEAERLSLALAPDQKGFVAWSRRDATLEFLIRSDHPSTARSTVDDLLACLGAAERTLGITSTGR